MIFFCADDYGLSSDVSRHILQCADEGLLNKISAFSNFDKELYPELFNRQKLYISLHLNLVEGKAHTPYDEIPLLADKHGMFKHTFVGLLKLSLFKNKQFKEQIYREIKAQILYWKDLLPEGVGVMIDSHQHTHMIPSIFKMLMKVIEEEKLSVKYLRIPSEPVTPFLKTPSLYFTYKVSNIIKQWLLKFLWLFDKKEYKKHNIDTAYFMGILFSGNMDYNRVSKILPHYQKLADRNNRNIEVLFHPGYTDELSTEFVKSGIKFKNFYLSPERLVEYNTVINNKLYNNLRKEA